MNKHTTEEDLERYKGIESGRLQKRTNMCVEYCKLSFFINGD